jgi:outer membrane protein OmpA-like peptidoglycan-associated protein
MYTDEVLRADGAAAPTQEAEPRPDIFSISPEAGSEAVVALDRGSAASGAAPGAAPSGTAPEMPGEQAGGNEDVSVAPPEPEVTPPPEITSEAAPESPPEAAPETAPEIADVPPSPVPELLGPAEPASPPSATAEAEPAAPADSATEPAEPALPAAESGGEPSTSEQSGAETEVAALPTGDQETGETQILFDEDSAELSVPAQSALSTLADQLLRNESERIELIAYASGGDEGEGSSYARRLSLSRAIAVRRFLIDQGVASSRMDVRALGDQAEEKPADRVDVLPAG